MAAVRCRVVNKVERRGVFDADLHMLGKQGRSVSAYRQSRQVTETRRAFRRPRALANRCTYATRNEHSQRVEHSIKQGIKILTDNAISPIAAYHKAPHPGVQLGGAHRDFAWKMLFQRPLIQWLASLRVHHQLANHRLRDAQTHQDLDVVALLWGRNEGFSPAATLDE
jgi:hypothetical protein